MFHGIKSDEGARTSQASFAVHSDSACVRVAEVLLTAGQELLHDAVRRCRAIGEDHVFVVDPLG